MCYQGPVCRVVCAVALALFVTLTARVGFAEITVFGPHTYTIPGPAVFHGNLIRTAVVTSAFCVGSLTPAESLRFPGRVRCLARPGTPGLYVLRIVNHGVASAAIALNGNIVFGPKKTRAGASP